jgi:hypothetical protein
MKKALETKITSLQEIAMRDGGTPERYPMSVRFDFIAGKRAVIEKFAQTSICFRCEHLVSNVKEPNLVRLETMLCANVNVQLGEEGIDLNSTPDLEDPILGVPVNFPWMTPANRWYFQVSYNGRVPNHLKNGDPFTVIVTLVGEGRI